MVPPPSKKRKTPKVVQTRCLRHFSLNSIIETIMFRDRQAYFLQNYAEITLEWFRGFIDSLVILLHY